MKSILRSTTRNLITSSRRFENLKTTEEIPKFFGRVYLSINELLKLPTGSSQPEVIARDCEKEVEAIWVERFER